MGSKNAKLERDTGNGSNGLDIRKNLAVSGGQFATNKLGRHDAALRSSHSTTSKVGSIFSSRRTTRKAQKRWQIASCQFWSAGDRRMMFTNAI
jgi:hypothetical protein